MCLPLPLKLAHGRCTAPTMKPMSPIMRSEESTKTLVIVPEFLCRAVEIHVGSQPASISERRISTTCFSCSAIAQKRRSSSCKRREPFVGNASPPCANIGVALTFTAVWLQAPVAPDAVQFIPQVSAFSLVCATFTGLLFPLRRGRGL
ncbi:hypothetical protein MRX96_027496 [Rhipicephalus microplus]